jgi:hypothetical protein
MTKLINVFRNFVNAPGNQTVDVGEKLLDTITAGNIGSLCGKCSALGRIVPLQAIQL